MTINSVPLARSESWQSDPHQAPATGEQQREMIRRYVADYRAEHGYSPSIAEISAAFGRRGNNGWADYHLRVMRERHQIASTPGVARSLRLLD